MNVELTDATQVSNELRLASSLRKQRWVILAVGLAGSAFLIAFLFGAIPGVTNGRGIGGVIGVSFGAVFIAAAGVGSWWLWTRIANFRTRGVLLTDAGIQVQFVNGSVAQMDWNDAGLRFAIKVFSNQAVISGATLQWGSGGIGRYARISRSGAERVNSEATSRGLSAEVTSFGKPPNLWQTTEFSRN